MYRMTTLEVNLRRQEQLREAEYRRWAATVRRPGQSGSRIARALGLRPTSSR